MPTHSRILRSANNPTKAQSRQHFPKEETWIEGWINFSFKTENKRVIRSKQRFRIIKMEWWRRIKDHKHKYDRK